MSKGKYAARAANRLATLDNDLLRDKTAEVEQLKARVAELETQLRGEKHDRDSTILRRANELAADQVRAANEKTRELAESQLERDAETAHQIAVLVRWVNENTTPNHLTDEQLADRDAGLVSSGGMWLFTFPAPPILDGAGRIQPETDGADIEKILHRLVGQQIGELQTLAFKGLSPTSRVWRRERYKDVTAKSGAWMSRLNHDDVAERMRNKQKVAHVEKTET